MTSKLAEVFESVVQSGSLIHCITNPIAINLSANGILALGCRPIMAEHPKEAAEVTSSAKSLLLNCGNLTDARIRSMNIAAKTALKLGIPVVLDAVGASAIKQRRSLATKIIRKYHPTVIKGNYSEITALYRSTYKNTGVDADVSLTEKEITDAAIFLARKYSCVVLASGRRDIVSDGRRVIYIENGTAKLTHITGTGCLLGAITAVMLTSGDPLYGAVIACAVLGIAGELVPNDTPNGTFAIKLIDELSAMNSEKLLQFVRMEELI